MTAVAAAVDDAVVALVVDALVLAEAAVAAALTRSQTAAAPIAVLHATRSVQFDSQSRVAVAPCSAPGGDRSSLCADAIARRRPQSCVFEILEAAHREKT